MGDVGLLLSLPTDSIAVRVALASVVAVVAGRLLLRVGLRSPKVRAGVALLPALAIAVVAIGFAGDPALPSLWHTSEATGGLSIPVRDTYLSFVPAPVPLLLGLWAAVTSVRLTIRCRRVLSTARTLRALAASGEQPPPLVARLVQRLSSALRATAPEVLVVPELHGGAVVIGVRHPLLLVDDRLVQRLDRNELEGVLAHELAHIVRRDNLVAGALGVLRDVFFFVPGGAWSLRRLLREREHAADVTAVDVTGRPGALAGGLLKVLEAARGERAVACASLLSEGTLVARVGELCDERPPASRLRRHGEVGVALVALTGAVAVAVLAPDSMAGEQRQRDALGVLLSEVDAASDVRVGPTRSAVFDAFDEAGRAASATAASTPQETLATTTVLPLDDPEAFSPQGLQACADAIRRCTSEDRDHRMLLQPEPVVRVDSELVDRWRLAPVVRSDNEQWGLFWFQLQSAG